MDFGAAEAKLAKDHAKLRNKNLSRRRTLASDSASSKAKKAEEYRRKQLEKKKKKDLKEKKMISHVQSGFNSIEQRLGIVQNLGIDGNEIELSSVSVHGLGDKITLPSSILSTLAEKDLLRISQEKGQPLFFRLGIRRTDVPYNFPQSEKMKLIMEEYGKKLGADAGVTIEEDDDEHMSEYENTDIDDQSEDIKTRWMEAYLEEMDCKYVSYTYTTVVEFSQDEGFIGIPFSVANNLLQPDSASQIDSRLTVDPAMKSNTTETNSDDNDMQSSDAENLEDKTPGHAAYGLFPVPVAPVEVTLLNNLPLGKKCTLQPTIEAIKYGFYNLKNVKLALEQSLIRTRGSLNVGDCMYCWFRGKKFELNVKEVVPSDVRAISCVNCDIEVDIAPAVDNENDVKAVKDDTMVNNDYSRTESGGYRLTDNTPHDMEAENEVTDFTWDERVLDVPEEPIGQSDGVVVVQIRGSGKVGRRKFRLDNKVKNLFDFAISEGLITRNDADNGYFKLVTRFPRRVFQLDNDEDESITLSELSLTKQEMFMIEK